MDSRNGTIVYVRLPDELIYMVDEYAKNRRFISRADAFRELIETHPRIAELATSLYDRNNT